MRNWGAKSSMRSRLLVLAVAALSATLSFPLDRAHFIELEKKGREQAKQQNWKGLRETLVAMGKEMPVPTPVYMLRMASVETHLGNRAEAIRWMERYAATGLKYDPARDDDLKPLASDPAFASVALEMKERTQAAQKALAVCALPLPDLMPEDLTFDRIAGTFVVSSIQHHTLYRVTLPKAGGAECTLREIALEDQVRRWPALALSADATRNLLWMTASAMPGFTGFPKEDQGKTALFALDGASGKIVRRFDLASGGPGVLGDMSVADDGTVYVSDSIGGGVYRVQGDLKTAVLEKIAGDFFSPQTPVMAADGKRLFVADYSMGVGVVDLTGPNPPGQLDYLAHPEAVAVTGLDGLYLSGDSLFGIQNGTQPARIMRYQLNPAQTEITSGEVVEQATERMGEATHVIGLNGWLYITANVGWNRIDDHGRLKAGERSSASASPRLRRGARSACAQRADLWLSASRDLPMTSTSSRPSKSVTLPVRLPHFPPLSFGSATRASGMRSSTAHRRTVLLGMSIPGFRNCTGTRGRHHNRNRTTTSRCKYGAWLHISRLWNSGNM